MGYYTPMQKLGQGLIECDFWLILTIDAIASMKEIFEIYDMQYISFFKVIKW